MDNTTLNFLKERKGMAFIPRILLIKLRDTLDVLLYDAMDKILFLSKSTTGVLGIEKVAKDFGVNESDVRDSFIRLKELGIVSGTILTDKKECIFSVDYERILTLEVENGLDEEKKLKEMKIEMFKEHGTKG